MKKLYVLIIGLLLTVSSFSQIRDLTCPSRMDTLVDRVNDNFDYLNTKPIDASEININVTKKQTGADSVLVINNGNMGYAINVPYTVTTDTNVYYIATQGLACANTTTISVATTFIRAFPFYLPHRLKFHRASIDITVGAAGGIIFGIYSKANSTLFYPDTLITSFLFTDTDGTPAQPYIYFTAVTLEPGWYFLVLNSGGNFTARGLTQYYQPPVLGYGIGNNAVHCGLTAAMAYDGTLPATYPAGATYLDNIVIPSLYLRQTP